MDWDNRTGQSRRLAIIVQYDGTPFNGWQIQDTGRTIQGELEKALLILTKEKVRVTASGRTDSGVHALGQVVHFNISCNITLQRLCVGLNGILPVEIAIKNAYEVPHDFHARYSAVERIYTYYIYNYPERTPFMRYRAMWVNDPLDIEYMRKVANYLVGEHDFASFCKKKSADENTIRRINEITIETKNQLYIITIRGNAFLHNMIRIIVGTMIELYKEQKAPEYILEILRKKDREISGATAPAYGLYLEQVLFEPSLATMTSAHSEL